MKKAVFIVFFISFSLLSFAQESPSKNEKNSIEVLGNCDMCKKRIEKAAFSVKGVKYASWDNSSAAGHDTEHHNASKDIYDQLPACCQYVRKGQEPKPGQMTKH
ncbi:MAG: metal transporter [Flavobacteriaceae bacterium]